MPSASRCDVADFLGIRSEADIANIRVLMSRMARDGRIDKLSRARYLPPAHGSGS